MRDAGAPRAVCVLAEARALDGEEVGTGHNPVERGVVVDVVNRTLSLVALMAVLAADAPLRAGFPGDLHSHDGIDISDAVDQIDARVPGSFVPANPTREALTCSGTPDRAPAVVLSEIQYNPSLSQTLEFIEVHNRSAAPVSLAGYRFTSGIDYAFPADAVLPADAFAVVLKEPANSRWRGLKSLRFGPYNGALANGGEKITLANGECSSESVEYGDRHPWPIGPDGGATLERLDELTPASDFHAWRTSRTSEGTPGAANSAAGVVPRPVIDKVALEPRSPSSRDVVRVIVRLDEPASALRKVVLSFEAVAAKVTPVNAVEMTRAGSGPDWAEYEARIPPQASQTMVRMNFEVQRIDGRSVLLPDPFDPGSFMSYFVYDFETPAKLPVLWLYPPRRTALPGPTRSVSGAVVLETESPGEPLRQPRVFDGADLRPSRQGIKLKFLKGKEYRGDRTLNIIPETGGGGTRQAAPHMEHMGFFWFRLLGAIAPRADWFRVVDYAVVGPPTQRLVIQEINERFLEMNGLSTKGDLYKYVYQGNEKHTNLATGLGSLNDLLARLASTDAAARSSTVRNELDLENVGLYSLVSELIANWDGFHNNLYLYNDLTPGGRWKAIPWDLDQVFEVGCATMPVTRPLTGEGCNPRPDRRPLADPYHAEADLNDAYLQALRDAIATDGPFSPEAIIARIDEVEKLLLDDLTLLETSLNVDRASRRSQILRAYAGMRQYAQERVAYLKTALGM